MGAFTLDIRGQLNSIRLAHSKVLWPLFEAIVNSIHAIEDSPQKNCGTIKITVVREENGADAIQQVLPVSRINSFIVEDNGIGFNEENFKSFNTAYSTYKIKKGCKGIGRFLWLKAFSSVKIESTFLEKGVYYRRRFTFTPDGVSPDNDCVPVTEHTTGTKVELLGLLPEFKKICQVELDVIAKKAIEHCLLFFASPHCPSIIIDDHQSGPINLNTYFEKNIKDSLHQDVFTVKDYTFTIYHLRVPEGANAHELHFCANMQEVASVELKKHIPDLNRKICPLDMPGGFYYVGYLTSKYLDSIVNTTRTSFDFDERNTSEISLWGSSKETILATALGYIRGYLSDYITEISQKKKKQIDSFVEYERPTYRYLLKKFPDVYNQIPAGLASDDLDIELHRAVQKWEATIKERKNALEEEIRKDILDQAKYDELFEKYWGDVTELSKTCLAEYVTRRKTLLGLIEDALTIQQNGKFKNEKIVHSLICPMQHTSDDLQFEEMNLWVIDERLAFHSFLASDKTLRSIPIISSESTKEPDIAVFDSAFAYAETDEPFNSVTIIEFKKPDNDKSNPLNQIGEYIDLIRGGKKTKANGQTFSVTDATIFRGFVICDLTEKMKTHCLNSGLSLMADGLGYCGYNPGRKVYYEVISYKKLLLDAKKRNNIFFDKLFSPKPSEIIHLPSRE